MLGQAASGLSIKAFCAKRKISLYQFYSWRRLLRELLPDQWQPLPKDEHGLIIADRP